ncbi:nucleotidyltransferase family protein [Mesorhizobium sp. B2-3-13]|uniref:nucleotidyltransferase family protein n=1 Tax=Mesorhizobium sp. B2-3-13 TaxID=2589951 RepID=UPI00112A34E9|nr:nucleotidyltransferase family protein [Mesorhizobium sp. B2-3-13]TPL83212.1 nucleotidyltransferase family protein [Mesorhizobium sp. B2-3-13]
MTSRGNALKALVAGLRGAPTDSADWQAVIALANHTLLTADLFSSLARAGQIHQLPQDVREYLRFVYDCNRERNLRLRTQLREAVAALNGRDIVPFLLKGAVPLFLSPGGQVPSRMTSDLDLAVDPREETFARTCLEELGYVDVAGARGMAREHDAGMLELRSSQPTCHAPPELVQLGGLRVNIPPARSRALHWMVHDLLKEGDYWRGRIDLRHLHDLARLAESEDVDWMSLQESMPDRSARNALDTQLLALHHFFGTRIPAKCTQRPMVRFQHWRRVFTATHPIIGAPLRLAGNLMWGIWRFSRAYGLAKRGPSDPLHRIARTLFNPRTKI